MKLALFLPNWIGDAAMASPLARHLRNRFGRHGKIVAVATPGIAEVVRGASFFDEILIYHPKSWLGPRGFLATVGELAAKRLDAALLLPNSPRTALLAWVSGIPTRIGYSRSGRSFLLTDQLVAPRARGRFRPISAVDYYLEMAYLLGCPLGPKQLELATTPEGEAAADRVWNDLNLPEGQRVVVIHAGAAFGPAKQWPPRHFAALARGIVDRLGLHVLFLCGPGEREYVRRIVGQSDNARVRGLIDIEPSIALSKACIRRSCLVVTTDSGPRHLAAAFGKPTVVVFGSTVIDWSVNYNPDEVWLQHSVTCGPCQRRTCPLGHYQCLRDLRVEDVFQAVAALAYRQGAARAA